MRSATEDRARASRLPEGDVIRILLEQHVRIRELFDELATAPPDHRQAVFNELRALLAVHETAEELVLRPVSRKLTGESVADARSKEEQEANEMVAELETLEVSSTEFERKLAALRVAVEAHGDSEEREEFPAVVSQCDLDERRSMGDRLRPAESLAPTHPHPPAVGSATAQMSVGPIASLLDKARDALAGGRVRD